MIINFSLAQNIIAATHLTGIYDVNRSTTLPNDDYSLVNAWANSIISLGLHGIIFHNNFSDSTCKLYSNTNLHFVKVVYNPKFNPNVFRYFIYCQLLKQKAKEIQNIFFTDISDVEVLKNPFHQQLFIDNPNSIFCGDEPEIVDNPWMQLHSEHLRVQIDDYFNFETDFKKDVLLNCGIIGGNIKIIEPFINKLSSIHSTYNADNKTAYTGDMGAFNYLIRTKYNDRIIHGCPINTVFKTNTYNDVCWFKHK
jgi:hypothetical protein